MPPQPKVWRALADEKLVHMASSLAAALLDETNGKLRQVFDAIDTDSSGSIDKQELKAALGDVSMQLKDDVVDQVGMV